jgi:hypothetical protein
MTITKRLPPDRRGYPGMIEATHNGRTAQICSDTPEAEETLRRFLEGDEG